MVDKTVGAAVLGDRGTPKGASPTVQLVSKNTEKKAHSHKTKRNPVRDFNLNYTLFIINYTLEKVANDFSPPA